MSPFSVFSIYSTDIHQTMKLACVILCCLLLAMVQGQWGSGGIYVKKRVCLGRECVVYPEFEKQSLSSSLGKMRLSRHHHYRENVWYFHYVTFSVMQRLEYISALLLQYRFLLETLYIPFKARVYLSLIHI